MRLIFLGAPGAGKGTYAGPLSREWKILTISTGDILRENVKQNTVLGQAAKAHMERGALVPDEIVTGMMAERLSETDAAEGFILDGFPRTIQQAEALDKILVEQNHRLNAVVNIEVSREVIIQRLTGRRACPQCHANYNVNTALRPRVENVCDQCGAGLITRSDDNEETITQRLAVYAEQTAPLIDFYRRDGLLRTISAAGEIPEILNKIRAAVEGR